MKRMTDYFGVFPVKKVKSNSDDPTVNLSLTDSSSSESNHDYPDVWSLAQKNEFCEKYDWLCFKDQKLGCKVCKKIPVNFEKKNGCSSF